MNTTGSPHTRLEYEGVIVLPGERRRLHARLLLAPVTGWSAVAAGSHPAATVSARLVTSAADTYSPDSVFHAEQL
jgi:hypothetical protein